MSKLRRRVFIVNDSGHDFSAAERYGDLVTMSEGPLDKFNLTAMRRVFDQFLQASNPGDFILHSGPGVMNALACSIFASLHGRLNLLLYRADSKAGDHYVARKLVLRRKD